MIERALLFLRDQVRSELTTDPDGDPSAENVVFVDGDHSEPMTFPLGAVSLLLINLEEERIMRPAEPYVRREADGAALHVQPDIRLVLYILFVARYRQYEVAWAQLSKIVQLFQSKRSFSSDDGVGLSDDIHRLSTELLTLRFGEQNEIWSSLRATYHPSIAYRVHLVAFRDREHASLASVRQVNLKVKELS
jgi:hypothetical protein